MIIVPSSTSSDLKRSTLSPWWLLLAALLLFWNLGYAPLWNPDEGRYAAASLEMAQPFDGGASDWVVPHLNTVPRLNKPPLVYWLTAGFFKLLGVSTEIARLASAFAAVIVLLIIWRLGHRLFDETTGVLGGLVWATSALPFVLSHTLNTDMLLTACVAMALFGLVISTPDSNGSTPPHWAYPLAGVGLGLALLAKGPVGFVLPFGIWGLWLILTRSRHWWRDISWGGVLVAIALSGVIAAPWYVAIAKQHPEFLKSFLLGENIARLTGTQFYHKPQPFYFYLIIVLVGLFPWTCFLLPTFTQLRDDFRSERARDENTLINRDARWLLWIWALAIIGLFSISKVKLITYILPAFPALALLISASITSSLPAANATVKHSGKAAISATGVLLGLLAIIVPVVFLHPKLLGDKLMPISEIAPLAWTLCGLLTVAAAVLFIHFARRSDEAGTLKSALWLGGTGMVLFVTLIFGAGRAADYEDPSPLTIALSKSMQPNDVFVEFRSFVPTTIFYLNRPVTTVDVENRSGWDEETRIASPYFPKEHEVLQHLLQETNQKGARLYVLVKWKHAHWPTIPKLYTIAQTNDYRLLSNKPAPPGFILEKIAPRQRNRPLSPECKVLSPRC